ncbi:MAG: hypothetical protein ACW98A_17315 [Candidatus Hodarchaeales archaeon]
MYNSGYWGGEGLVLASYGIYLEWFGWGFTVAAIFGGVYLAVKSLINFARTGDIYLMRKKIGLFLFFMVIGIGLILGGNVIMVSGPIFGFYLMILLVVFGVVVLVLDIIVGIYLVVKSRRKE